MSASTDFSANVINLTSAQTTALAQISALIANANAVTLPQNSLFRESFADGLIATGSTQATALALTNEENRFATVALGTGAMLPASAPGVTIIITNHGANSLQVYGAGTDTIDDVATATGITQMIGSAVVYICFTAGAWYTIGNGSGYSGSFPTLSFADGLTANSGGVQAGATPITTVYARFTTVAAVGNSALLPAAAPGLAITVINAGANLMNVFPAGADAINTLAASAAYAQGPGSVVVYYTTVSGKWHTVFSASGSNAVTQLTSNTTAVTSNSQTGVITSFGTYSLAVNTSSAFTVNCSNCLAASAVDVCVDAYSGTLGTNGVPVVTVSAIVAGSFVINVTNPSANALSGTIKFSYRVD